MRKHREREAREARLRDLDETRRLLHAALIFGEMDPERSGAPKMYELAATLTNAIAHHSMLAGSHDAATHLIAWFRGEEDDTWLRKQLDAVDIAIIRETPSSLQRTRGA